MTREITYDGTYDLPELNIQLLRDLVHWAKQDDEKFKAWGDWNQKAWAVQARNGVCRTAYCIAGQAVAQAGFKVAFDNESWDDEVFAIEDTGLDPEEVHEVRSTSWCIDPDDSERDLDIETTARRVIGLTYDESRELFHYDNTIEDIERFAREIADARGLTF